MLSMIFVPFLSSALALKRQNHALAASNAASDARSGTNTGREIVGSLLILRHPVSGHKLPPEPGSTHPQRSLAGNNLSRGRPFPSAIENRSEPLVRAALLPKI
jgi:hypothetical protein